MKTGLKERMEDLEYRVEMLEKVIYTFVDFKAMSIYRKDVLKFREIMEEKNAVR